MNVLMKCGCAATGVDPRSNKPVCAKCYGLKPGADEVADVQPDLTGRIAACVYCKRTVPSSLSLAFFEKKNTVTTDSFYCGCRGWN